MEYKLGLGMVVKFLIPFLFLLGCDAHQKSVVEISSNYISKISAIEKPKELSLVIDSILTFHNLENKGVEYVGLSAISTVLVTIDFDGENYIVKIIDWRSNRKSKLSQKIENDLRKLNK